jgi:O-succinylbenzoic acid--CoA ligase
MSETCGGCVYDGAPLPGVRVHVDPADDRVSLGGPVVAEGYPDLPALTAERFGVDAEGTRWFRTDDRGTWRDGRLTVLGRLDDVVVTGGHKVEPRDVETALRSLPAVRDALVVGVPDAEWGQRVAALLVPSTTGPDAAASLGQLRTELSPTLPPHALPRQVDWRDAIPLLPSGKPDRAAARAWLADAGGGKAQEAVAE